MRNKARVTEIFLAVLTGGIIAISFPNGPVWMSWVFALGVIAFGEVFQKIMAWLLSGSIRLFAKIRNQ